MLLVGAVALAFGNAIDNDFVFDDHLLIVDAPGVKAPLGAFVSKTTYRPLRTLSYRLDYALGGMDPRIFHLSNVVYHALTVLAVCSVLTASGAAPWAAGAGAMLFAVHPVQTDAVTYAAGRRDVLCGLFYALGFLAYLRLRARGGVGRLVLVGAAWVLALAAKEMAATLPLVCVAYERFARRRAAAGRAPATPGAPGATVTGRLVLGAAGIGLVAALVALRSYGRFLRRVIGTTVWHGGTIGSNFATVARVWTHYLGLVLWPAVLTADYSDGAFPVSPSVFDPRALAAGGVLVVAAVLAWRRWRHGSLGGFGAAWCAVTLLPVSHLVPYHELLAEHYLYIPMIGVAFVATDLIESAVARVPAYRRSIATAVVLVLVAATARTIARNGDWQDKLSLWSATVKAVPECARARFNLGHAYFERVRLDDAEREWSVAAALKPDDFDTEMALATVTYRKGELDLATAHVESALALKPGHTRAQALAGWIALDRGEPDRAIAYFDAALKNPRGDGAHGGAELGKARALAVVEARKRPRPVESEEDHR